MYTLLEPELHFVADTSQTMLEESFGLRNVKIEEAFDNNFAFIPLLHWKTKTHIIICEVSNRPFPLNLKTIFSDLIVSNIPAQIFVAYPEENELSLREFHKDLDLAKSFGIGLISVNSENEATINRMAVSVPLLLSKLDLSPYVKNLKPHILRAYTTYMNGDAKHGVQELGQIVENIIRNLAITAKRRGDYASGGDPNDDRYSQGKILNDLVREAIIDAAVLGRCRSYVEDRNGVSHKPRSIKRAKEIESKMKQNFLNGLRILEDLPRRIREKGYRLKIN